jgi:hypothetical protein
MTNIYKPPASDVINTSNKQYGNALIFNRFSAWFVLGLSVVTLNLYAVYWLYSRTKKLNEIVYYGISENFCRVTTAIYCASYVVFIADMIAEIENPYFRLPLAILDLIGNVLVLVWVYKFRNRLSDAFTSENFRIGIILPFFLMQIYLQYKVNELIDINQHNKRMQSDKMPATRSFCR